MNKLEIGLLLSIAIVIILGWKVLTEVSTNQKLVWQVVELDSKLKDKSAQQTLEQNKQNFDLENKCSHEAQTVYLQLGYKNGGLDYFQSHYNSKLNKCLMVISSTDPKTLSVSKNLFDAYEQKSFGTYFWMADKFKKNLEVAPKVCTLYPDQPNHSSCKSESEFTDFANGLMNG
jgi:hypothetical protein